MGMITNCVGIMVATKNDDNLITFEAFLENEERAILSIPEDMNVFNNAKKQDIISIIEDCFELDYEIYDEETHQGNTIHYNLRYLMEEFDDDTYYYSDFLCDMGAVQTIDDIEFITVFTNNDVDYFGPREYDWAKFDFENHVIKKGNEIIDRDDDTYFFDTSYVLSLEEKEAEKEEKRIEESKKVWIKDFDHEVEKNPEIIVKRRTFVMTGLPTEADEQYMKEKIEAAGGFVRTKISGKTNYLVVDPTEAGYAKVRDVKQQREKGKTITIVYLDDLKKTLGI